MKLEMMQTSGPRALQVTEEVLRAVGIKQNCYQHITTGDLAVNEAEN